MANKKFVAKNGVAVGTGHTVIDIVDQDGHITANTVTISGTVLNATAFAGTANNASYLEGSNGSYYTGYADNKAANAYSNSVSYTDNKAANAYTNATTFASNASNITTGTLTANVLATSGVTANTYGNSSSIPVITIDDKGRITSATTNAVAGVTGFTYTPSNSTFIITTGAGSTFPASITAANDSVAGIIKVVDSVSNVNIDVAASANSVKVAYDNAATAYSNAATYADNKAANAYSNAVSYADNKAANAYSNATTFAANATNISSGTLAEARLPYRMDQNVRTNDTVSFGGMTITGNLTVTGTTVTVNANNLSVQDNMIYLNNGSNSTNVDLGIAGNYNDGTYRHTGFFRDASDGVWKVYDQYLPEPDASQYIDTANASFRIADFQANVVTAASFSGNGASVTSVNAATVGGNTAGTLRSYSDSTAATAYSNATSYAATIAGTAYSNATSYAASIAGTAYSNATSYAASIAATAYSNAVSVSSSSAATAYSNAVSYFTTNYTASDVLTKIKTVDGSGSGLDADLLDGISSDGFMRSAGTENAGSIIIRDNRSTTNYYSQVALEIKSADQKAIIGLHRDGYSHCGISHETSNQLRFNFNNGDAYLNAGIATIWGSGNDGSGSGLDADTLDGVNSSGFVQQSGTLSSNLNTGDYWFTHNDTNRNPSDSPYYPNSATRAFRFHFAGASFTGTGGNYAGVLSYHPWDGTTGSTGDASYQLAFGSTAVNGGGTPQLRIRKGIDTTWNSWYDIWTSANDGSGSGLDADTVDGLNSSQFLRSDTNTTLSGILYFTDSTNGVYKSGGRLTIRSESTDNVANFASYGLYLPVSGQTAGLYAESAIEARAGLRIGSDAGSGTITVGATTSATANRIAQRDSSGRIYSYYGATGADSNWVTSFQSTPVSGYQWHGDISSGGPTGAWWFYESMRHSNSGNYWGTQIAWGWEDNSNQLYQRNIQANSFSGWVKYWNSGNDGSGSGLDADTVDGINPSTSADASTIAVRDSGGDIYGRYFFGAHFNQSSSNSENPSIAAFWTNNGSDNYCRKSTPAHVISQLGLLTTSNYNSYAVAGAGYSANQNLNTNNTVTFNAMYGAHLMDGTRTTFNVGGNASTYYPVRISIAGGSTAYQYSSFIIERGGYDDPGYSGIGFSNMHAKFELTSSGWGFGSDYVAMDHYKGTFNGIAKWYQEYQTSQLIVWLRGATQYNILNIVGEFSLLEGNPSGGNIVTSHGTYTPTSTVETYANKTRMHDGSLYQDGSMFINGDINIYGNIIKFNDNTAGGIFNSAQNAGYRPDDIYGNTYMFNFSGGWYGDFSGYYFRNTSSSDWAVINSDYLYHYSDIRTPIFYNSNDTNSRWEANYFVLRGGAPTVYFRDTDHNSAMIHVNSNIFYVLRGSSDTESWSQVNSYWPMELSLTNNNATFGGSITCPGNITASSDAKLKENVSVIENAIDKVKQIRGVTYTRNDLGDDIKRHAGVIAQEVEKVLPEVVDENDKGFKTVAYGNMIGLLIEAIKEQQKQIDELKAALLNK